MHHVYADKRLVARNRLRRRIMGKELEVKLKNEDLSYNLTFKEVVDILKTIDNSPCKELHLELADLKLMLVKK
ncbi:MAG: hypothetical protein H8E10_00375 [Desulfobacterales bacterium]|nr:hypothetical protein [Desulfobacterales bacterium]